MERFQTIPEMLLNHASRYTQACSVNDRIDGTWVPVPLDEICTRVRRLGAALNARLPGLGHSIGVLAAPSADWLAADIGIMLSGGVAVPFFVDFAELHFLHKVNDSDMKTIFVFGAELWDRFRPYADHFDLIITDQLKDGMPSNVKHIEELYETGQLRLDLEPGLVGDLLQRIDGRSHAVTIYTSGSTGMPKGVELTQGNLAAQLHDIEPLFPVEPGVDKALSLLPVAHTFERTVIYLYLLRGLSIYFVDQIENVGELMRDVHPAMMTVVPRLMEKTYARIREKAAGHSGLKGRFAVWTFKRASRPFAEGEPFFFQNWLADRLVGWQVKKALGGKLKAMVVGGAHMPDELNHFFVRVGVPLFEGYGMTESSPVISTNYPGSRKVGTVGRPLASVEVKIAAEGEVWARGPNVMRGYRHMPDETARVIDADGWLHTGDLGSLDDEGFLSIAGRKKEMFKTSTGETVFPAPIEQALCRSPLIDSACVIAEGRKYTSCLLFISAENRRPIGKLHGEIQAHIREVNKLVDHWETIRAYALIRAVPSVDNGELTPTLKIRRHVVAEDYRDLIEALYDETQVPEDSDEISISRC